MADDQDYLETLYARRQKFAGISRTQFGDRSTDIDLEQLNAEIARVEAALNSTGSTRRLAVFSKGV